MPYSAWHAASCFVETAAREFRRNGIQTTGLADVMAAAGLTHGGFYRHFQSKDRLAEACAAGMESIVAKAEDAACQSHSNGGLEAIIESYLASSTTLAFF
jgi:TetR/AcrR family transcriptional repressor of nem operon